MRRRWLPLVAVLPLVVAVACGSSDEPEVVTQGSSIGDRYVRLFEVRDFGASLFVFDAALPPNLAALLNPGLTDTTPDEDIISIPVPPEAVLLGSYDIRRRDGTHEIWLAFDVPGLDTEVEQTLRRLLDETPWQVTGGQSNELFGAVSFQSTMSGDIEGFVTVQALPSAPTFTVTVERAGEVLELEIPRGAFIPEIDARYRVLRGGLEITDVLSDDQLQEGDLLTAVGSQAVASERDLFGAFRALGQVGESRTAALYSLTILSPSTVTEPEFVIPRPRPVPEEFPADFLLSEDLSVVEVNWNNDASGDIYQITMVTERSAFEVADDFREAIDAAGWTLTGDEAQGFGTLLGFEDPPSGIVGAASIDEFESDDQLNAVILQVQVGRGTN